MERTYVKIVVVALSYVLLGHTGLLLAIPPGYATAIFPPAGLALAVLLLYGQPMLVGIWLGSFILNLSLTSVPFSSSSALVAVSIASGSTLQAYVGSRLLWRFRTQLPEMLEGRHLLLFGVGVSMVTTTIAATTGIATLIASHAMEPIEAPYNWLTWWVGDSLGVLITCPILFILFGKPVSFWRQMITPVLLPLALTFLVVVLLFIKVSDWEMERQRQAVKVYSQQIVTKVNSAQIQIASAMELTSTLFEQRFVRELTFHALAQQSMQANSGLIALEWVPELMRKDVAAFELEQSTRLGEPYAIKRVNESEPEQSVLFPVVYAHPHEETRSIIGLDLYSEVNRRNAIDEAFKKNAPTFSKTIQLKQKEENTKGTLLIMPIAADDDNNRALIVGVVWPQKLMERAIAELETNDLFIQLHSSVDAQDIYFQSGALAVANDSEALNAYVKEMGDAHRLNEQWQLLVAPTSSYLAKHRGWQSWVVLVAGLLFTALLGLLLYSNATREHRTLRLVAERTRELHQNNIKLKSIMDSVKDAVFLLDANANVLECNAIARTWLNKKDAMSFNIFPYIKDKDLLQNQLQNATELKNLETTLITENESPRAVELSCISSGMEHENYFTLTLTEVSHRYELDRLKSEFISMVSHELRTPLTSIRGAIGLLLSGKWGELNKEAKTILSMAVQNSERLSILINDLLDLERLELGKLSLNQKSNLIYPILESAFTQMSGYALEHKINLKSEFNFPKECVIHCDADRLIQVLANLVSNAIKFSRTGGSVQLNARLSDKNTLLIEVIDHGIGIAEDKKPYVFQKFWQADSSALRKHRGSGLGLWITKALIERMSGTMGFESTLNVGSRFYLLLPIDHGASFDVIQ